MKTKEKKLLALLHEMNGDYISSREIAAKLDISERTVRTYIRKLQPIVEEKGARIEARQGSGYRLIVPCGASIETLICENRLVDEEQPYAIDNAQERRDYIFQKLLLDNECPDQFDLANRLYVSESTIRKDLTAIRPMVESYSLQLVQNRDGSLHVRGEEQNKRNLIMDYFFRSTKLTSLREFMDGSGCFEEISPEALLMMIIDETRKVDLRLSDIMIQNLMIHLALCIKRVRCGFQLETIESAPEDTASREGAAARAMMERLSKATGLLFSQQETDYLILHLISRSNGSCQAENATQLANELQSVLVSMEQNSRWSFSEDKQLHAALFDHLVPMLVRLKHHIHQANPLTRTIQDEYPEIFDLVREEFSKMPSLSSYTISDDEWAYLALHVMAAAERSEEKQKLQVLVICSTGYGSSKLLHSRLMKHFSNSIHIVSETGCFSINDELLKDIDLIISTVNFGNVIFGVPFLVVSVFLNDKDISAIQAFIDKTYGIRKTTEQNVSLDKQNEFFHRYFDKSRFLLFDSSYDASRITDTLTTLLADGEKSNYVSQMKEQMKLRSKMGSVAFSDTVVVPHPAIPLARKPGFAVGIVPDGVYWDDEHPSVKFFLLMSPSYLSNEGLNSITMAIVDFLEKEDLQKMLLCNPTFEQFETAFKPLIQHECELIDDMLKSHESM